MLYMLILNYPFQFINSHFLKIIFLVYKFTSLKHKNPKIEYFKLVDHPMLFLLSGVIDENNPKLPRTIYSI